MASGGSGLGTPRSDLFLFDRTALKGDILLHEGKSRIDYHEYAVYRVPVPEKMPETLRPDSAAHGLSIDPRPFASRHVSHSIGPDHPSSDKLFDLALRQGHGLNAEVRWLCRIVSRPMLTYFIQGEFVKLEDGYDSALEGRVRHMFVSSF